MDTVLLTIPEMAARLRCGERTVREMIAAGRIPIIRVGARGGAIRMDPAAVLAALVHPRPPTDQTVARILPAAIENGQMGEAG